ncbi:hypothetical protein, partial [Microbacterium sp. BF1]|uniref:hypothetical protein n=1 Tax=Microbacterium sp. BF1 TaxID=2821146 RepID=UPI001C4DE979
MIGRSTPPCTYASTAAGNFKDGTYVYFDKSDGGQFQAAMVEGQDWDKSDYSSKLIGGQYFYA